MVTFSNESLTPYPLSAHCSAPDLTNQMNLESALLGSGESLRQWSDRVLTLAFPQLPNMHAQAIPRLCHRA